MGLGFARRLMVGSRVLSRITVDITILKHFSPHLQLPLNLQAGFRAKLMNVTRITLQYCIRSLQENASIIGFGKVLYGL